MSSTVETITPDTTAVEVAERLHSEGIGSMVVMRDGEPVGIVTESDMVRLLADKQDADELTASDCMSAPVITIDTTDSVQAAVELFRDNNIKKLPVMDDGELVGIVTTTDLSYYIPHLTHGTDQEPPEGERRKRTRVDTAYENESWEFESLGQREDHIDVGDTVKFSKTLTDEDVRAFAEASGDTNRLHLDEEYASGTRFGGRIAHGTLVAGTISAAIARLPGLIIYISQDVSYLGPVAIDDRVTAVCEVVEDIGHDRYRLTTSVINDDTEVIDGEAVVLAAPIPDTA